MAMSGPELNQQWLHAALHCSVRSSPTRKVSTGFSFCVMWLADRLEKAGSGAGFGLGQRPPYQLIG